MAHPSIFDREWEVLMRSGQVRAEFNRLRQQVVTLTTERDALLEQVSQLTAQANYRQRAATSATPPAVAPVTTPVPASRARPAPAVAAPPPVIEEPKKETAEDDSAARFGLLELD